MRARTADGVALGIRARRRDRARRGVVVCLHAMMADGRYFLRAFAPSPRPGSTCSSPTSAATATASADDEAGLELRRPRRSLDLPAILHRGHRLRLQDRRPRVVGHSLGGLVATAALGRRIPRPRALALRRDRGMARRRLAPPAPDPGLRGVGVAARPRPRAPAPVRHRRASRSRTSTSSTGCVAPASGRACAVSTTWRHRARSTCRRCRARASATGCTPRRRADRRPDHDRRAGDRLVGRAHGDADPDRCGLVHARRAAPAVVVDRRGAILSVCSLARTCRSPARGVAA